MSDDPFDMFGSDSESDHDDDDDQQLKQKQQQQPSPPSNANTANSELAKLANKLLQRANGSNDETASSHDNINTTTTTTTTTAFPARVTLPKANARDLVDVINTQPVTLPWPSPKFVDASAVAVFAIPQFGGGRGYCALRTLPPGTTILIEEPVLQWSDQVVGKQLDLDMIQTLLEQPQQEKAQNLVHWLEDFHPIKRVLDQSPSEKTTKDEQLGPMMEEIKNQSKQSTLLDQLVQLAKRRGIVNRDQSPITATDILRMLLCIRYNGLESGIYLYAAMLNHNCHPNCAKFLPEPNEGDNENSKDNQEKTYSEVVTTREVCAGEALTISYCPNIMSHASRRRYLYHHHRFDISATVEEPFRAMELVHGELPPSSIYEVPDVDSPTRRVEQTLDDFDSMYLELAETADSVAARETLKALELSILELGQQAKTQLGRPHHHVLLIRIDTLHLDVCEAVRRTNSSLSQHTLIQLIGRQVTSAHRLVQLQSRCYGSDHFDLARSHLDLANAIAELLSRSPSTLYQLGLTGLDNFQQWSQQEKWSRNEHHRIREMYSKK